MKAALVTLGCKLNYAETSTYERALAAAGWEIVPWNAPGPDLYIVNTCSVTERSDKKSRSEIRKLHRLCPQAAIVVTGCSAQLRKESLERIEGVRRVFGAREKSLLVPWVLAGMPAQLPAGTQESFFNAWSAGERTRSFLKVQDGCDYKCNYCTVPYARGESRSPHIGEIVREAEEITSRGVKEIVITGVNTGDFGRRHYASDGTLVEYCSETFLELLQALQNVEGIERYRISSVEPNLLTDEIIDWIASEGTKILPHFHIPLQSGSDTVLKAMGRRYDTAFFARKIAYIRERLGRDVFFGIDVIVGFPGETEELFEQTCTFLREVVRPAFIHIFPYSQRPGTPAADYPDQVRNCDKTARVERLEQLCAQLHGDFVNSQSGRRSKVLFESTVRGGKMFGYTENYIRVERPFDPALFGKIIEVTI